ncbi:hypothetical protein QYE76_000778 [Lolium multiflorum]|uniref:Uncharacterized protein n=1 Tax=Lolium multiflorum TaxID=4521 RepID=A0AAD8VYP4_LOLMU|nr:hypothetical protein QYE76_000778 [Lolium multiflorum]
MATEDLEWERSKISNQDMNLLKRLGFTKKKDAALPPRGKLPISSNGVPLPGGLSILHVSIFITLCEYFLESNLIGLCGRIFCLLWLSHGIAYNIGVRRYTCSSDIDYFDVKFLFRPRVAQEVVVCTKKLDSMEYNIAHFDGKTKFLTPLPGSLKLEEEKLATEAMTRIGHLVLSSLPPLPEGGEVEERAVVTDDNQGVSRPESGVGGSHKSAASLEKENETEVTSSTRSSLPAASPKGKRKRDEIIDSGASKADTSRAEKTTPNAGEETLDLYDAALISSDDEEEDAPIDETARQHVSYFNYLRRSSDGVKLHLLHKTEHPTPAELIRFGTQFIGYRDYAGKLEEKLAEITYKPLTLCGVSGRHAWKPKLKLLPSRIFKKTN